MAGLSRIRAMLAVVRVALVSSLALLLLGAAPQTRPAVLNDTTLIYLPLVMRAPKGIIGVVDEAGMPAAGVLVELRRFDPGILMWSVTAQYQSDSQGRYAFEHLDSLQPGELYGVVIEPIDPNRLLWCAPPTISNYKADNLVQLGTCDIAGIADVDPAPDAQVTLPYTFRWIARPATQQDHYTVDFSGSPPYFQSGDLGRAPSFTLNALPQGAVIGPTHSYYWQIIVASPDGSRGLQYSNRRVYFNNSGALRELASYFARNRQPIRPGNLPGLRCWCGHS